MPTYEYQCSACGHEMEEFQSFSEEPLKLCPKCKKKKLVRLIGTGTAILFKGSGFYETDYRSDAYKSAASADSKTPETKSSDSSSKDSTSSAAKETPAPKSTAKSSSKKSKD